ncbi:hypothetical protein F4860DRAFT_193211 [Xylaria cubensis]|nr:hypothetical protein F4860DRAFT_193211 [Xylaria cubensis]
MSQRQTTFKKYLENCHKVYQTFVIGDKLSTGENTDITHKFYPQFLKPWTEWSELHQGHFQTLTDVFGLKRPFPTPNYTSLIERSLRKRAKNNENDVEDFETRGVADAVELILEEFLKANSPKAQPFNFTDAFFTKMEITYYLMPRDASSDPQKEPPKRQIKPDFKAWSTRPSGGQMLAFVCDYKAAHKLNADNLKSVLANETLFMDVLNQLGWNNFSTDSKLNAQQKGQRHIAMALIQVYDYMIVEGVKYGYLAAGKSFILLYVDRDGDKDAMKTLYYYPCIPGTDVDEHGSSHTAVAQLTTFYLHSLCSEAFTHKNLDIHRKRAEDTLKHWPKRYEEHDTHVNPLVNSQSSKEESAPNSQTKVEESDGSWTNDSKSKGKSKTNPKAKPKGKGCSSSENPKNPGPDNGDNNPPRTPGLPQLTAGQKRKNRDSSYIEQHGSVNSGPVMDYCTQACLLSLKQGGHLDKDCPNVLLHYTAAGGTEHPLNIDVSQTRHPVYFSQFIRLVEEQLYQNLFQYCIALDHYGFAGKSGSTGRLFKVELAPYGYIFVGKGILHQFHLNRLQHESQAYLQLERFQGQVIPVYLGIVNLAEPWGYSLPGGYQVLHMLLMSWAGEMASVSTPGYAEELDELEGKLWNEGVSHEDVRRPNVLWNQERNGLMLIDFDRAIFRQPAPHKQVTKLIKTGTKRGRPVNDILEKSAKRARTGNTPQVLRQAVS